MKSHTQSQTFEEAQLQATVIIPENGSVVIIDDEPNEAFPIVKALSQRGVATNYYRGSVRSELPTTPLKGIRLLFLDLQLLDITDEHQIARSTAGVLNHIISVENGPYLLVIWSKKFALYGTSVKLEIQNSVVCKPVCIVNFDKNKCLKRNVVPTIDSDELIRNVLDSSTGRFDSEDEQFLREAINKALQNETRVEIEVHPHAVEIIEAEIKKELEKAGVFHLFVMWENLAKRSSNILVKSIADLAAYDENWEMNMRNIFKRMGLARVGSNNVTADTLIKESINTLNTSFIDSLESEIKKETLPAYINLETDILIAEKSNDHNYSLRMLINSKTEKTEEGIFRNEDKVLSTEKRDGLMKSIAKESKLNEVERTICTSIISKYNDLPAILNTKLHIDINPTQELIPGNIYFNQEQQKKLQYIRTFFNGVSDTDDLDSYQLIDLEVSPICDYAQQKWKRSRTLPGIIYLAELKKEKKTGNYFYDVEPKFDINGSLYKMRFDFHLFNALDKVSAQQRQVMYRLKRELLLDIIAQLSAHVNRPGISFIP